MGSFGLRTVWCLLPLLLLALGQQQGCLDAVEDCDTSVDYFEDRVQNEYAQLINRIDYNNTYVEVAIRSSASEDAVELVYQFVRCGCDPPEDSSAEVIFVPTAGAWVADTVLLGLFVYDVEDMIDTVVAIPSATFVSSSEVHSRVKDGTIIETSQAADDFNGLPGLFDPDVLPDLPPVAVLSPFTLSDYNSVKAESGARAQRNVGLLIPEVSESSPLGRAEYIKVLGILTNQLAESDQAFQDIESNYIAARNAASNVERRPSVMLGLPFGGTWTIPRGNSYTAALLADANADYRPSEIQSNVTTAGTTATLTYANIAGNFTSADYWVNAAAFTDPLDTIPDLLSYLTTPDDSVEVPFTGASSFVSVNCDNVWANDNDEYTDGERVEDGLANNYFEEGVVRPEIILRDLVEIFHPGLLEDHELRFYRQIVRSDYNGTCPLATLEDTPPDGRTYISSYQTVAGVNRFQIEDVMVSSLLPDVRRELGLNENTPIEVTLASLRTTGGSADMNMTMNVPSADAASTLDQVLATNFDAIVASSLSGAISGNPSVQVETTQEPDADPEPTQEPDADPEPTQEPDADPEPSGGLSGGAIAGIVIGSVVGLCFILAIIFFFVLRKSE